MNTEQIEAISDVLYNQLRSLSSPINALTVLSTTCITIISDIAGSDEQLDEIADLLAQQIKTQARIYRAKVFELRNSQETKAEEG
jgi:hypothetical protein